MTVKSAKAEWTKHSAYTSIFCSLFCWRRTAMKIIQSYNQNAVIVLNDDNQEMVVVGKGIGFGKKPGDVIEDEKISKIFRYQYSTHEKNIIDSIANISPDVILIAEECLAYASVALGEEMSSISIFALANHLHFAMQRESTSNDYNPLSYEIKYAYPEEFKVSNQLIEYLKEKFSIKLAPAEATYLTFHLVNASVTSEIKDALQLGEILSRIMEVIEEHLNSNLNKDTIDYSRFILHLRYFLIKNFNKEPIDDDFANLYSDIFVKYPIASAITEKVANILQKKYAINVNSTEKLYILLHLQRILESNV